MNFKQGDKVVINCSEKGNLKQYRGATGVVVRHEYAGQYAIKLDNVAVFGTSNYTFNKSVLAPALGEHLQVSNLTREISRIQFEIDKLEAEKAELEEQRTFLIENNVPEITIKAYKLHKVMKSSEGLSDIERAKLIAEVL